jgi:hypothetical protein
MSLLSRFDRPNNVRKLGEQLAASGKTLEKKDVDTLLGAAKDLGSVTQAERAELQKFFDTNKDRFAAEAREAMARFLGVPSAPVTDTQAMDGAVSARESRRAARSAPAPQGGPSAEALAAVAAKLPEIAGQRFKVHPDGYMAVSGKRSSGAPKLGPAGAERVYRSGKALAEAPRGVLKGLGAPLQEKLFTNSAALYDQALAQTQASRLSPIEAHRLRSGAFATMLAVVEGADTPELKKKAAERYLDRAMKEPHEGIRDTAWRNLAALRGELPAELGPKIDALKSRVLPERPPYDEWFKGGNKTLNVRHYAHDECWDHATDPIQRYQQMGLKVVRHDTGRNEEKWVLEGKLKDPTGKNPETPVRLEVIKTHDEFMRDMDDPNVHCVFYSGHSNLGGNVSEAIRRGPGENGKKLLYLGLCRGQQNIFEVANKYPNAHLTTTQDPHYFVNMMDGIEGTLRGIARRDSWDGIQKGTRFSHRYLEGEQNLIRPNEERRYEYVDRDRDGKAEITAAGRDRFFDLIEPGASRPRFDLVPRPEARPVEKLDGSAVMDGVNFARTLLTYHAEKGHNAGSAVKHIEGDRVFADGWFDPKGSGDLVRVREEKGKDGKPVYQVAVSKDLAHQSTYAIGALVQYEMFRHFSEKRAGGTFTPEDKARALVATGEYLAYMYCSLDEADAILGAVGQRAGVRGLNYAAVEKAIDAGEGYAGDEQTAALAKRLGLR